MKTINLKIVIVKSILKVYFIKFNQNFIVVLKIYRSFTNKKTNDASNSNKTIDSKEFELSKQDKLVKAISSSEIDSKLSGFSLKSSQKSSESSIIILSGNESSDNDEDISEEEITSQNNKGNSIKKKIFLFVQKLLLIK